METATKHSQARIRATLAKHDIPEYDGITIPAYVNHGRWVADCPCNGAELAAPGEVMVCGSCGARNTVVFPSTKDRKRIEGLLGKRPALNQNWRGESVDELLAENIEQGVEVL